MKIAVIGAGGLGSYVGARLIEAGCEVHFLARGKQLEALQSHGLSIDSYRGAKHFSNIKACDGPKDIGQADAIILAVKMYDLKLAAASCLAMMQENTFILCLQNGVEHIEITENIVGADRVLAAAVYIAARVTQPGHVRQSGKAEFIEIADHRYPSERAEQISALLRRSKIDAKVAADMAQTIWRKFTLVAASGGICAYARKTVGEIRADPQLREMLDRAIREAAAVGRAEGVALPDETEDVIFRRLTREFAPEIKASQLIDLERGKPLELEWLSGAVVRLGRKHGIPTPVHEEIYAALKPFASGRRN